MSIESNIEALTAVVIELTNVIKAQQAVKPVKVKEVAPVAPAHVVVAAAPVAPTMPAPPSFFVPVAAPVAPVGIPFNDGKTLIEYVMGAYKALGPVKGAGIQGVLTGLGYQNINDVKPEHYSALYAGVEALKL